MIYGLCSVFYLMDAIALEGMHGCVQHAACTCNRSEVQWSECVCICVCCDSLEHQKGLGFKWNGQQQMLPVVCCRGKLPLETQYGGKRTQQAKLPTAGKCPRGGWISQTTRPVHLSPALEVQNVCAAGLVQGKIFYKKKNHNNKKKTYYNGAMGLSAPVCLVSAAMQTNTTGLFKGTRWSW